MKKKNSRYRTLNFKKSNYVVDKYIFRSVFLIMIMFFFIIWITSGYSLTTQNVHLKCEMIGKTPPMVQVQPKGCENPLYREYQFRDKINIPDEVFDMEYLPMGYEINKPPVTITYFPIIFFGVMILGIFYNHIKNNVMRKGEPK